MAKGVNTFWNYVSAKFTRELMVTRMCKIMQSPGQNIVLYACKIYILQVNAILTNNFVKYYTWALRFNFMM